MWLFFPVIALFLCISLSLTSLKSGRSFWRVLPLPVNSYSTRFPAGICIHPILPNFCGISIPSIRHCLTWKHIHLTKQVRSFPSVKMAHKPCDAVSHPSAQIYTPNKHTLQVKADIISYAFLPLNYIQNPPFQKTSLILCMRMIDWCVLQPSLKICYFHHSFSTV